MKRLRDTSAQGNESVLSCATSWCSNPLRRFQLLTVFFFFFVEKRCPSFVILLRVSPSRHFVAGRGGGRSKSLMQSSAQGHDSFPSWYLNRLTRTSEADKFSRSSQSATSKSHDHPLHARKTWPMKLSGKFFLPN